jgi:hypothetical protein
MLVLTIVTALGGFALGAYATFRYAPTLARRPGSLAVGIVVCVLVGAAAGLACMHTYLMVHDFVGGPAFANDLAREAGSPGASTDAETLADAVIVIATQSGVLLALAATAFLLAPAHRPDER